MLPPRVLVVEDDEATRTAVVLALRQQGYATTEAADGAAAAAALRAGPPPRLVLLDLMMPATDGWDFLATRRLDPVLAAVPVVAFTAAGGVGQDTARALGVDAVVSKPAEFDELLAVVRRFCDGP
jgi:CheY-like chemotaxis protein